MTRSGSGRIVAIGGGHGLSVVLGALVDRCDHLTAVVSVADDGGSSGRLRRDLGIVAPGDMRRCLAALAPAGIVRDALEYRFDTGVLDGHPAGNVMLASMLEVEDDIVAVMDAMVAMVGARGRVLPATSGKVDLIASAARGTVKGQVAVSESDAIKSLRFAPDEPDVPDEVIAAIDQADVVVLGPGSLYTSVLAALVPGIRAALEATDALVVYVANLAAESTETEGYDLVDHINAVRRHGIEPDIILAGNDALVPPGYEIMVIRADLAAVGKDTHDPLKLAAALEDVAIRSCS
ncbi:MAG: uridine diphosphate-N-acetylglucosamine-binding protein YvcK [Acidimicrobiaceae bacterium]|nr:uridine diphosphate-N-acetylglucosamine-binding protein YvcK [Acidimicrobiaceae bacterium]MBT5580392.1 uridine diphosphate-N-acetylglucosamine-binding protein YvcK [Acidimicrobiaceae bacterium]MBT5849599.1 uridine diphosphate-N-acetylglucosamine-binding protein YvcK [Acidimicrobiaceae bacterium]